MIHKICFAAVLTLLIQTSYTQTCVGSQLISILSAFESECFGCEEDLDSSGVVSVSDLVLFVSEIEVPLDIVPRFYGYFNDQKGGFTIIPIFPTVRNSDLTWEDIADQCEVHWVKDGEIIASGHEVALNSMLNLCDGAFPITMRIIHNGWVYERTEIMLISTVWTDEDSDCDYGMTAGDADQSTLRMSPFFFPDLDEGPYYNYIIDGCRSVMDDPLEN